MQFIVHTDGGARGNPGPAAVGVVIESSVVSHQSSDKSLKAEDRKLIAKFGKRIGEATNNVAEYRAVQVALHEIKNEKLKIKNEERLEIQFYLDSTLVVNQLNGLFKVKDPALRGLLAQIRILEQEVGGVVRYSHIPRERNWRADFLVNKALDS